MTARIVVVDYGIGNLHSVVKALRHEGGDVAVTSSPADIAAAEKLVLPGVGAFADGMRELSERKLIEPLHDYFGTERPFLGICLGMQLLLGGSDEFGSHAGLGFLPGRVVLIRPVAHKIPHIGWNALRSPRPGAWNGSILEDVPEGTMTYFVHSYSAVPEHAEDVLATSSYGDFAITAAVRRGAVTGCQFHPEKSGPAGLAMLRRFVAT